MENKGYLTQDDLVTMLMNYPIGQIDNITDGLAGEVDAMKKLNPESIAKLSEGKDDLENSVEISKRPVGSRKMSVQEGANVIEPNLNQSASVQVGGQDQFSGRRRSSKRNSSIPDQYGLMSSVNKRKNSADSIINYQIQCTTINNRIKQYVSGLFLEYDDENTGQFTLKMFKDWISQHPVILTHFEGNFHVNIWRVTDPNVDKPAFKSKTPEANFYADIHDEKNKKKERVWVELHRKFLIFLQTKEDNVPKRVVLLDGLTLTLPQSTNHGKLFHLVLSHKSPFYRTVHIELEDAEMYNIITKKLSYLQE